MPLAPIKNEKEYKLIEDDLKKDFNTKEPAIKICCARLKNYLPHQSKAKNWLRNLLRIKLKPVKI